jgi:hypothetical protein
LADERPPASGGFGRIESALSRLERRIDQVAAEVQRGRVEQGRRAPETRVGLPEARTQQRRITEETGTVEGNTRAWERNRAAREADNAAAGRSRGGVILPSGTRSVSGQSASELAALEQRNQKAQQAQRAYELQQGRVEAIRTRNAATVGVENANLQRQIQIYGSSSQALRKHGALTTEFISAAARGNVTFAEMRYQVGATTAKFAGWTAAAAAVYGALAAVNQLGKGAIDSSNGVNQLQRVIDHVDSGRAQSGFRNLSQRFNLPIADVAQGQYEFGKRFNDQNEALRATPALLYAVKVGELSVADASKFLVSTVNAYGLSVDDLTPLLDQFNSLQNNMGVNIRDTAAGVAKASGQFRAAGGDLNQLIAIVGAGTRVTGLSGDQFGTLLQRSAGLINRPKNQEILKGLGIDPTQGISQIYDEAFKIAPTLARRNLVKLAEGLSTPQLAPRLTALLARPDIYRQALANVAPDFAKGSAERELQQQLGSIQERAKRLGVDLQSLGSVFSSSGGLVVPGAFIAGLDHVLRLTTSIVGGLTGLPGPLGQSILPLLTILGLMKGIRRFNLGDSLAARSSPELARLFNQSPERRARGQLRQGLQEEQQFFQDERERAARQAAVQSRRVVTQRARVDELLAVTPRNAPASELAKVEAAQVRYNAARKIEAELVEEEAILTQQIAATQARVNAFERDVVKGKQSAVAFARQEGIVFPQDVNRPTIVRPGQGGLPRDGLGSRAQAFEARVGAAITGRDASLLYADRQKVFNAALASSGRSFNLIESAALRTTSGIARAGSAVARGASAIRGIGTGIARLGASLLAGLGPLDVLLIAAIALPAILDRYQEKIRQAREAVDNAQTDPLKHPPHDLSAAAHKARDAAKNPPKALTQPPAADFGYPGLLVSDAYYGAMGYGSPIEQYKHQQEVNARLYESINRNQARAAAQGKPLPGRRIGDITADRNRVIAQARSGAISMKEARERINELIKEYAISYEQIVSQADPKAQKAVKDRIDRVIEDTKRGTRDLHRDRAHPFAGLDAQGVSKILTASEQLVSSGDHVNKNLKLAFAAYHKLQELFAKDPTPENLATLAQARDQLAQTVQANAQTTLDRSLLFAHTPAAQHRAYDQYDRTLRRRLLTNPANRSRGALDDARGDARRLVGASDELAKLEHTASDPNASIADRAIAAFRIPLQIAQIEKLKKRALASAKKAEQASKDQNTFERKYREFQEQEKQARYQLDTANRQSFLNLRIAGVGDPFARIAEQIRTQARQVAAAIKTFGRGSAQVADEMAKQKDLLQQQAEQNLQLHVLQVQGRYAGATTPAGQAKGQLAAIDAELKARRADPKLRDPIKIQELMNQRASVVAGMAQQVKQDATDLIEAQYAYRESLTDDPIALARLEYQKAKALIPLAKTKAERLQAQANANVKRRALLQTRQQESYDEIQFLADVGRITAEEQITRLQQLLKTIHGNRNLRRQIMRDLHNLQDTANQDYNLDLDSLRLPTPYEVRRAILGGGRGRSVTVHNSPKVEVNVANQNDVPAVGAAIDGALNTSTNPALRSAGLI